MARWNAELVGWHLQCSVGLVHGPRALVLSSRDGGRQAIVRLEGLLELAVNPMSLSRFQSAGDIGGAVPKTYLQQVFAADVGMWGLQRADRAAAIAKTVGAMSGSVASMAVSVPPLGAGHEDVMPWVVLSRTTATGDNSAAALPTSMWLGRTQLDLSVAEGGSAPVLVLSAVDRLPWEMQRARWTAATPAVPSADADRIAPLGPVSTNRTALYAARRALWRSALGAWRTSVWDEGWNAALRARDGHGASSNGDAACCVPSSGEGAHVDFVVHLGARHH